MAAWPKKYRRPAMVIFSNNNLIGVDDYDVANDIITTDHGRSELQIKPERIESADRMVNGTYRSHFVAEKVEISVSWTDVPSRSVDFLNGVAVTADTYRGGNDIIEYLESKSGHFYLKLVYDKATDWYPVEGPEKVVKVMVKDYSYSIKMRAPGFDIMDISVTLVEV